MSGWKPISTAPKDGTRVDLWLHGNGPNAKDPDLLKQCREFIAMQLAYERTKG